MGSFKMQFWAQSWNIGGLALRQVTCVRAFTFHFKAKYILYVFPSISRTLAGCSLVFLFSAKIKKNRWVLYCLHPQIANFHKKVFLYGVSRYYWKGEACKPWYMCVLHEWVIQVKGSWATSCVICWYLKLLINIYIWLWNIC